MGSLPASATCSARYTVLHHYVNPYHATQVPALPRVVVFITNRRVPIPDVLPSERFLIAPLALSGVYHVIARYGYVCCIRHGLLKERCWKNHILYW